MTASELLWAEAEQELTQLHFDADAIRVDIARLYDGGAR